ncbi:hypothetical protein KJ925_05315, partial [Patescibacteria group bacterium]|nr:hypothetical protein [Patescibacteria group bacterium]
LSQTGKDKRFNIILPILPRRTKKDKNPTPSPIFILYFLLFIFVCHLRHIPIPMTIRTRPPIKIISPFNLPITQNQSLKIKDKNYRVNVKNTPPSHPLTLRSYFFEF